VVLVVVVVVEAVVEWYFKIYYNNFSGVRIYNWSAQSF
jgi:hypothetical protein